MPTPYTFHGFTIPEHMMAGLLRYIEHGVYPGDFLTAVLENDLKEAVGRADDANLQCLPAYVGYLYNEAPGLCWGTPERVRNWVGTKRVPEPLR
jgi:hypothetical protein